MAKRVRLTNREMESIADALAEMVFQYNYPSKQMHKAFKHLDEPAMHSAFSKIQLQIAKRKGYLKPKWE